MKFERLEQHGEVHAAKACNGKALSNQNRFLRQSFIMCSNL